MCKDIDLKEIGKRVRMQREALKLTREMLAEKLNVSAKFCADIEYGAKGISIKTLVKLSDILNLSTDYILKGQNFDQTINEDQNYNLKQSILAPLNSCNPIQLKRAEQMIQIFVDAVNEGDK